MFRFTDPPSPRLYGYSGTMLTDSSATQRSRGILLSLPISYCTVEVEDHRVISNPGCDGPSSGWKMIADSSFVACAGGFYNKCMSQFTRCVTAVLWTKVAKSAACACRTSLTITSFYVTKMDSVFLALKVVYEFDVIWWNADGILTDFMDGFSRMNLVLVLMKS